MSNLEEGISYKLNALPFDNNHSYELLKNIYSYLRMMGLIECSHYPTLSISITPFGKLAFNILSQKNSYHKEKGKVIYLNR